ncbi:hypothetical protein Misp01_17300 [Microtetraspora sp. NBRC 13810]|uniref:TetR/AcrR family transcriptional regulator n=1 Tax=Microtetraspora sp. NBRC 13810 TaxID=3030990 RepID=UPI0024A4CB59|nr:TetR/AcrR family transcriptional regulator [Microtetraspora sp. NBRC 13810]GLW06600.1 hypothetical protein Misp01_17300 [Microtetraspora sp. NBRC 13810]
MTCADGRQAETILRVATRLFAALGYDGTSTSQIAEAAGLDLATVNRAVGGKRELYLAVMDRAHHAERAAIAAAIAEFTGPGRDAPGSASAVVHGTLDRYLDFCAENPDVAALWIHRWLADAADLTELEGRYAKPLIAMVLDAMAPALAGGDIDEKVDLPYALRSVVWCVQGFATAGMLDEQGRRLGFSDPRTLRRFRAHLHGMVHRILGLPGDPP